MVHRVLPPIFLSFLALSAGCQTESDDDDSTLSSPEICDGLDNDGDGEVDESEAEDAQPFHPDADLDGHGDLFSVTWACEAPPGSLPDGSDCDDQNSDIHPDADEVCNGVDDNCDGGEDQDPVDGGTFFRDADGDGFGDPGREQLACKPPVGYVSDATDCDDDDETSHPGALELCGDEGDNDCDGVVDTDCVVGGTIGLSDADARIRGSTSLTSVGCVVSAAGDLNGDGFADVAVSACIADGDGTVGGTDSGEVYIVNGPIVGYVDVINANARLIGEASYVYAGSALAPAGDVNGDGYDDLLVGVSRLSNGAVYGGGAYLLYGPLEGTLDLGESPVRLWGDEVGALAGRGVAAGGDLNGDGYADLLLGAPGTDALATDGGSVHLVSGPLSGEVLLSSASTRIDGELAYGAFGSSVVAAGDVDGDGEGDLLVGSPGKYVSGGAPGSAFWFRGPFLTDLTTADAAAELQGEATWDGAGYSVAAPGDVDGDGRADLLVGALWADGDVEAGSGPDAGAAYLVTGAPLGVHALGEASGRFLGEAAGDGAGFAVGAAGDVNGDGLGDLLVGAPYQDLGDGSAGMAYLLYGPATGTLSLLDASARLVGQSPSDYAAWSLAGVGDTDGDGLDDFLVGAPGRDYASGYPDYGTAYLVRGRGAP